jgi:hypothetical protein
MAGADGVAVSVYDLPEVTRQAFYGARHPRLKAPQAKRRRLRERWWLLKRRLREHKEAS